METVDASIAYLEAVRDGNRSQVQQQRKCLATIDETVLFDELSGSNAATVFWCNVYNGFVRERILDAEPTLTSSFAKARLYYLNKIPIAGHTFSLQSIEHDILRKGQFSFGLGYLGKPLVSTVKKQTQPATVDTRIHFLLNCGAKSCPLIRILTPESYEQQADDACSQYLARELTKNESRGVLTVPRLFSWYRGDFGGEPGIRKFINRHTDRQLDDQTTLSYDSYNWETVISSSPFRY